MVEKMAERLEEGASTAPPATPQRRAARGDARLRASPEPLPTRTIARLCALPCPERAAALALAIRRRRALRAMAAACDVRASHGVLTDCALAYRRQYALLLRLSTWRLACAFAPRGSVRAAAIAGSVARGEGGDALGTPGGGSGSADGSVGHASRAGSSSDAAASASEPADAAADAAAGAADAPADAPTHISPPRLASGPPLSSMSPLPAPQSLPLRSPSPAVWHTPTARGVAVSHDAVGGGVALALAALSTPGVGKVEVHEKTDGTTTTSVTLKSAMAAMAPPAQKQSSSRAGHAQRARSGGQPVVDSSGSGGKARLQP